MCIIFAWKTACEKYFFQTLSQKKAVVMNLKNPDLESEVSSSSLDTLDS